MTQELIANSYKRIVFLTGIILLITIGCQDVFSQSLISVYEKLKTDKQSLSEFEVDSLLNIGINGHHYAECAKISHDFSLQFYINQDYPTAIKYAKTEIDCLEKSKLLDSDYVNALYNLAFFYSKNGEYEKSIRVLEQIIADNIDPYKVARSYGLIGQNYSLMGDLKKAMEFIQRSIHELSLLKDFRNLITQKIYLANIYLNFNDSLSTLKGISLGDEINDLKNLVRFDDRLEESLNKIYANFFSRQGTKGFKKSRRYHFKNLIINTRIKDSIRLGGTYSSLAYLYNENNKDSAGYFAKKGIELTKSNLSKLSISYGNYVEYLLKSKNYSEAVLQLDSIIKLNFDSDDGVYNSDDMINLVNKYDVLIFFHQKIKALTGIYIGDPEEIYLSKIRISVDLLDELVRILDVSSSDDFTRLFWRREASQAYLYGAYASHLLGDSEKAFEFMEKNKALLLSESVLKNTEFANLPKHISDEETNRQKVIYNLESKLNLNSENRLLQDSLFNAKRSHEKYVDSLKTIYPKYFARKINVEQIPLDQVKQEMNSDEALVSYIWNDFDRNKQLVVGLISTKENTKTFTIENVEELDKNIKQYQRLISKPIATVEEQKDFQKVAYELYQQLFPTDEIRELIKNKSLMIIADGLLQNIPFEALITEEKTNKFLILESDIHYSYSYSFLKHNEKVKRRSEKTFIGYSPIKFSDSTLVSLKFTETEVESIESEFEGIIKLNGNATKSDFLKNSSDVKIIHLATHADAGENPWIAFEDGRMELHELYTYMNNAELVTLSGCNTSLGEMAEGEGVISLARGFFHSGSKSVVSSLWRVNDKSTSEIMTSFYKYLRNGQTKSEALNNSKRDYIKSHSLTEQSPYYWSSFILIGDPGEIKIDSQNHIYYPLLLLVIPVGLLIRKKLRKAG